jgi:protoheme IX farnesyltransferase
MKPNRQDPRRLLQRLAWTGAALAFGLIVLGGVVRITGSGMGCGDDWPRCNGEWFPPLDLPALIEISHRWVAALVSLLVVAITIVAWHYHRLNRRVRNPATLALLLLVAQVLLGAITVKLSLPAWVVIIHFTNAIVLLAVLIVTALRTAESSGPGATLAPGTPVPPRPPRHPEHHLVWATGGLGFVVILFGAQVANFDAGLLCLGFPLCNGSVLPPPTPMGSLPWAHRMLAFIFLGLVLTLAIKCRRLSDPAARPLRRWAAVTLGITLAQIALGAAMVLHLLSPGFRAAHLLVGTALWAALVILLYHSNRTPAPAAEQITVPPGRPTVLGDLITLTKPRIISLLLLTTVAPMFITPAGAPSVSLVLWVLLGGYLMAGGANAINMWFDRDIDDKMSRTRLRPIPSGRIAPGAALAFGVALGLLAFAVFWYRVNQISAWLALGGLLFYVFVYTIWLKRSSPQNIVIGGAAGAFPPLVGWTAVTGELNLAAMYLFAIVFYWTPPHFWALALIKQREYAKAGVPMLPVVRGESRTKFEMLAYTLILLPLTIMPALFGALGTFYAVAAFLLGARLLWYCIRLVRERATVPVAWEMYRYSLVYLALLFVAMGVDRVVPFGHRAENPKVLILNHPERELDTAGDSHLGH